MTKSSPESWVDQYGDYLYRYALSRLHNEHLAEEAVQETFLAALKSHSSFSGQSTERTWFVGILRHKIFDLIRQRSKEQKATLSAEWEETANALFDTHGRWREQPISWEDQPEKAFEQKAFWKVFQECLKGIPQRLAQVFSLYEVEGIESKEICKEMGITSTNLWVMLYRARMSLRHCMGEKWFETNQEEKQKE